MSETHLEPRMPHGSVNGRVVLDGLSRTSGANCETDWDRSVSMGCLATYLADAKKRQREQRRCCLQHVNANVNTGLLMRIQEIRMKIEHSNV